MTTIRQVTEQTNWEGIARVFNHYVLHSTAAYPSKPLSGQFFHDNWQANTDYPFYEVLEDDEVVGFSYMRPFHPADSMKASAVFTYFISPSHTGNGIGKQLLDRLLSDGRKMSKTNFLVNISSDNSGSINFHLKNGFTECGRFRSVGQKNKQSFDMVWMQRVESPTGDS